MFNAFRDRLRIFSDRIGTEWFLKFGSDRIRTGSFRIGSDSDFKIYQLSDWELPIRSDAHLQFKLTRQLNNSSQNFLRHNNFFWKLVPSFHNIFALCPDGYSHVRYVLYLNDLGFLRLLWFIKISHCF